MPIGFESFKDVVLEHKLEFPGQGRPALMRKHTTTLHQKQTPTDDPDCPGEVKLAKQIEHMTGSKTAVGDAKEEFNLKQAEPTQVLLPTIQVLLLTVQKPSKPEAQ